VPALLVRPFRKGQSQIEKSHAPESRQKQEQESRRSAGDHAGHSSRQDPEELQRRPDQRIFEAILHRATLC